MKNNRRVIKEQVSTGTRNCINFESNPNLKLACIAGCFGNKFTNTTIDGRLAAVGKTTDNRYFLMFGDYTQQNGGTMFIYSDEALKNKIGENRWTCEALNETLNASLTPDLNNIWGQISSFYGKDNIFQYKDGMNNPNLIAQGYKLTKLTDLPDFAQFKPIVERQLGVRSDIIYVWVRGQARQYQSNKSQEIINRYKALGYIEGNMSDNPGYRTINLQDVQGGKEAFPDSPYYMAQKTDNLSDANFYEALKAASDAVNSDPSKKNCRELLALYVSAYKENRTISQPALNIIIPNVKRCTTGKYKFPFMPMVERLRFGGIRKTPAGATVDYSWGGRIKTESTDTRIKNILRESLIEIKELKKKSITEEKLVNSKGFALIIEEFSGKKNYNPDDVLDRLVLEYKRQESIGIPKHIIEQDLMGGLFQSTLGGIWDSIKERLASWIIEYLFPGQGDSEMAKIFVAAAGRLSVDQIKNIFSGCAGLVEFISATLVSYGVKKMAQQEGEGAAKGFMFDSVRNALMDAMQDYCFTDKLKKSLEKNVCSKFPSFGDMLQTLKT